MKLIEILRALRRDITARRYQPVFEAGRWRSDVLRRYPDVASALKALRRKDGGEYEAKEELVRTLVAEVQAQRHPFWTSMLLVVCQPMVCKRRRSLSSRHIDPRDLDHLVLESFLDMVLRFPLAKWRHMVIRKLRDELRREVFERLTAAQQERRQWEETCDVAARDPDFDLFAESLDDPAALAEAMEAALREMCAGRMSEESLELIVQNLVRRECLRYVFGDGGDEYEKFKRQRQRDIARLRVVLADLYSAYRRRAANEAERSDRDLE